MITGADDDLTPEAACRNLYSKFFRNDNKLEFISIENAGMVLITRFYTLVSHLINCQILWLSIMSVH